MGLNLGYYFTIPTVYLVVEAFFIKNIKSILLFFKALTDS